MGRYAEELNQAGARLADPGPSHPLEGMAGRAGLRFETIDGELHYVGPWPKRAWISEARRRLLEMGGNAVSVGTQLQLTVANGSAVYEVLDKREGGYDLDLVSGLGEEGE